MGILVLEFGSLEMLNLEQHAPGREHHLGLRRGLVRHRDHLDRGLRRPLSRHEPRSILRCPHHHHRRRHLRHVHRLPRERLPLTEEGRGPGRGRRCTGQGQPTPGAHGRTTDRDGGDRPPPRTELS